ncbi:DUF3376 domain-containing protein [Agromyces sp. Marseille-Q5079]|uniref:DUF3376 domain-containing protein n=1 Tax=Agromyces sp. Marseille-Q5079 TaxID=3439059 RepID=UPI003D9CBCC4
MSEPVPHDYVSLHLDRAAVAGSVPRTYGTFPEPEGVDAAPEFAGDVNARVFLPSGASPYAARGLRIALAMKGGVSLAVWIGGAVAELDVLRRIRIYRDADDTAQALLIRPAPSDASAVAPDELLLLRADAYARVLHRHGYDKIEFDVLAGASAGGLNAVMYAVAQRAGVGLDGILGTWLTTGSAWGLLQTGEPSQFDSVLRGDTFFWPELTGALERIAAGDVGGAARPAEVGESDRTSAARSALASPHVVVDLSATLIDGTDTTERGTAEGHAHFRFVGDDTDTVPDRGIPGLDPDADAARAWSRLAYAARTTSSFPGAFEPALIYSGEGPLGTTDAADTPDMRNVFSAHRPKARKHPFRVVDGGVLDNIPIDRALRAVRNVPANEHVNRALVYLDPSPKERLKALVRATKYDGPPPVRPPLAPEVRTDRLSRIVFAVRSALGKRTGESTEDEIDAVFAERTAALVRKGRDELLAVRLDTTPTAGEQPAEPWLSSLAAYTRLRSTADAELLCSVFAKPGEWTLGTNLERRPSRRALDRLSLSRFAGRLHDLLEAISREEPADARIPSDAVALGAQTLVDASFCVLSWVRAIEDQAFSTASLPAFDAELKRQGIGRTRAAVRESLYQVLRRARDLRDLAVQEALDVIDAITPSDGPISAPQAAEVAVVWLTENGAEQVRRTQLWTDLDGMVAWLQQANAVLATLPEQAKWATSPWHRMPPAGVAFPASDLPLVFAGSGLPTASSLIRFHAIGSDTQPAKVRGYRTLLDAQLLDGYRAALAKPKQELDAETLRRLLEDDKLYSSSKLAGLRIANFAGFLSTDWRRNDWWWGRLDASAGIISFLQAMEPAPGAPRVAESELETVHTALLRELNASDDRPYVGAVGPVDAPHDVEPEKIRERMVRGTQDLESLRSGYRIALSSRVVRAASSALVRDTARLSPARISQWLLRPLLVLAPVLLSTPRLILALIVMACGLMLTVRELTGTLDESAGLSRSLLGAGIATLIAAAIVAVRFATAIGAARARRKLIHAHLDGSANGLVDAERARRVVDTAERRARSPRLWLVVITVALLAVFFTVSWRFGLWTLPFWVALVVLVGITELAHRQLQTVAVARRRRPGRWVLLIAFVVAAIAVTSILPTWLDQLTAELATPYAELVWRSIAALVVVAAMTLTLFAATMRTRHLLLVLGVALVSTVAAVAATTLLASLDDAATGTDPTAVAIAAGITAAQGWAAYALTAWLVGTVLWWAPWFRGFETDVEPPSDRVWDLEPDSLVGG